MSTGVTVDDACLQAYNDIKLKRKASYVEFKISDDGKKIEVGQLSDKNVDYKEFHANLPKDECRYYLFDFEWDSGEGKRNKLIFINWAPDTCKVKPKMLYAGSKDAIRKKLEGVVEVQANDPTDAEYDAVLAKVSKAK